MTAVQDLSSVPKVAAVRASAFTVPTDRPEADGSFAWEETTLVLAEVEAGGETGLGFSYTGTPAAGLIAGPLREAVEGLSAFDVNRRGKLALAQSWCSGR